MGRRGVYTHKKKSTLTILEMCKTMAWTFITTIKRGKDEKI